MLDTETFTLQRIARSTMSCKHTSFSDLCSLFMILWSSKSPDGHLASQLEVYDCLGVQVAACAASDIPDEPSVAHLTGSRAAIGHLTSFSIWDLNGGILLSTVGPRHCIQGDQPSSGLLVANRARTKLAFRPAWSSTLHVFDARSLQLVCSLERGAGCMSWPLAQTSSNNKLVWGPYGWVVSHGAGDEHGCRLQLLQCLAEGYSVVQLGESEEQDELAASQCSPCGRMICIYDKHTSEIQIYSAGSGQILLRRTVYLVFDASACCTFTICWSRCSSRVVVKSRIKLGYDASHYLHILQLC